MSKPQPKTTPTASRAPAKAPARPPVKAPTRAPPTKTPTTKAPAAKTPARAPTGKSPPSTVAKPKAPSAAPAAAAAPKAGNWINRTVQGSVAGVGNYAGGFVNSIGDSVNKVGEGVGGAIANTTRYWGQGVAGYGNNLKDSVGVGGPRVSTAGNPLGMAGMGSVQGSLPGGKPANAGTRSAGKAGTGANPLGL